MKTDKGYETKPRFGLKKNVKRSQKEEATCVCPCVNYLWMSPKGVFKFLIKSLMMTIPTNGYNIIIITMPLKSVS